jgi:hypothetical protein
MRPIADFSPAWFAGTAAAAALSVACGSLDGHTGTPPTLATLRGEMTNWTNVSLTAAVRIAVVWVTNGPTYNVAEDLPVRPVFPSNFVIQLDQPPPQGAFITSNQGLTFQIARGFVVAYEDLNGNGKLDLVQDDAGAFVDKIVGANTQGMSLIYLQGTLPPNNAGLVDSSGKSPSLGYNLYSVVPCAGDGGDDGGINRCREAHWFDVSAPYDLEVSKDPEVNQLMCADFGSGGAQTSAGGTGWSVDTQGTPPGGYPTPGANGLTCIDGTSYAYSQCQVVHNGLCEETNNCTQLIVHLGRAPAPAGWPCACSPLSSGHSGTGWSVDTQGTPPGGYPTPGASGLTCHGTTSYIDSQCQVDPTDGLCNCTDLSVALGTAPAPAGWPCP